MLEARELLPWGTFQALELLNGGHRNQCYKVVNAGKFYVAKSTRRSEAALEWLGPVHDRAEDAGFRVPRLQRSRAGNLKENGWTLEPFLAGGLATFDEIKELLPLLERFHELTRGHSQRPEFATAQELLGAETSGDIDLQQMPAALVSKIRKAWRALPDAQSTIIHADFGVGNILLKAGQPPALIDWDECRVDAAYFDHSLGNDPCVTKAKLAWEIAVCWHTEPERARKLSSLL